MKLRTYIITFAAFSMAQALRICFSFNKYQIQQRYKVDDLFLGLMDFLYCLAYAIGACFHFSIVKRNRIKQTYFKIAVLSTITGSFYAIYSMCFGDSIFQDEMLDNLAKKAVLIVNISLFGFSQFAVWPLNLTLVGEYYKPQTDGSMIGLWGSSWQVGNIVCLSLSNFLIYSLNVKWEITVILFAIANFICASLINLFLQNPKYTKDKNTKQITSETETQLNLLIDQSLNKPKQTQEVTQSTFYQFIKQQMKSKQIKIYLLINGITSGIFLTFLFWVPIYMAGLGRQDVAGYMTMVFEVSAIIGSFFFGVMHQNGTERQERSQFTKLKLLLSENLSFISTAINLVTMICWILISQNINLYGILVGISGFFMGGMFNSMHSNDLFEYTKNEPLKTEMFAVLIVIINYIVMSFISLIVSLIVQYGHNLGITNQNESQYKGIFYILIILTCLNFALLVEKKSNSGKNEKNIKENIKLSK